MRRDPEKALKDLEEAVRLNPDLPDVYTLRGVAREGAFDQPGAEADLRKALERQSQRSRGHRAPGRHPLFAPRSCRRPKLCLDRALQIDPRRCSRSMKWRSGRAPPDSWTRRSRTSRRLCAATRAGLQAHVQLAALYYRLNRPQDGLKEREIVDRLSAEQQKAEASGARDH